MTSTADAVEASCSKAMEPTESADQEEQQVTSAAESEEQQQVDGGEVTTMMIRNVPRKYTSVALTHELQATLPAVTFNFVYLPWDSKASTNLGYGFVNFVSTEAAFAAQAFLDGKTWCLVKSNKTIKMVPANRQGLVDNVRQYLCNTSHTDKKFRPVVILDGQELDIHDAAEKLLGASFVPPAELESTGAEPEVASAQPLPASVGQRSPSSVGPPPPSSQKSSAKYASAPAALKSPPGSGSGRKPSLQSPASVGGVRSQRPAARLHAADLDNNWRRSQDTTSIGQPQLSQQPLQAPHRAHSHLQSSPQLPPQPVSQVQAPPPPMTEAPQVAPPGLSFGQSTLPAHLQSLHSGSMWVEEPCSGVATHRHAGDSWSANAGACNLPPNTAPWSGLSDPSGAVAAQGLTADHLRALSSPGSFAGDCMPNPGWNRCYSGDSMHSAFSCDVVHEQQFKGASFTGDLALGRAPRFSGLDSECDMGMGDVRGHVDVCMSEFSRPDMLAGKKLPETARASIIQSQGFKRASTTVSTLLMRLQTSQARTQQQLQERCQPTHSLQHTGVPHREPHPRFVGL